MAFSNNPDALELVIPEHGSLTGGSGTIYLGGPNLPAALTDVLYNIDAAILFYSGTQDSAKTDYYFIAHMDSASFQGWVRGNVHNGIVYINELIQANGLATLGDAYNAAMQISVDSYGVSATNQDIQFISNSTGANPSGSVTFLVASGIEYAKIKNLGVAPVIRAVSSTTIDSWQSITQTGLNINGKLNCTAKYAWYQSIDCTVSLRIRIDSPGGTWPAVPFLTVPAMPAAVPKPSIDSTGLVTPGQHGIGYCGGVSSPIQHRIDPNGQVFIWTNNIATYNFYEGSTVYQTDKP